MSLYVSVYGIEHTPTKPDNQDKTTELGEVVISSSRRIIREDSLIVIPSDNQRKVSRNGFDLLRGIMLPGIRVNTISGEVSTSDGQKTVVLKDGRPIGQQDILALRPKEVARVEYTQNPGAEYGYDPTIGAIINFIMKERTNGYAVGLQTSNAVTTLNGQNFAFGKYTISNSEFGISIDSRYTSLKQRRIDDNDSYMIGNDWIEVARKGINTPLKYTQNTFQLGYNNYVQRKHIFDITFQGVLYNSPERSHRQYVIESGRTPFYQLTSPYEKYLSPSLSLYYKKYLKGKSTLTFNFYAGYRNTDYKYHLTESNQEDFSNPLFQSGYTTDGKRQSYITEIRYYNPLNGKIGINTGIRGSYSYTRNNYTGATAYSDNMKETNLYTYLGVFGWLFKKQFYYYAALGASGNNMRINDKHHSRWLFRPEVTFIFFKNGWRFSLGADVSQNTPSLSQMADTELNLNRYESIQGNPDLRNWWSYRLLSRITGKLDFFSIQNVISYDSSISPVMEYVYSRNNGSTPLVCSFINQKRMSVFSEDFSIYVPLFSGTSLSSGFSFKSYQSRGHSYTMNLNVWNFNLSADWTNGRWAAGISWRTREKSLFGETTKTTGAYNNVYISYNVGQFQFGLMAQHLFCKNGPVFTDDTSDNLIRKNESVLVPAHGNMLMLAISWNFSKGKQRKETNIDMNNRDEESGILKYQ